MRMLTIGTAVCLLTVAVMSAQQADPLKAASDALGVGRLTTVRIQGFGGIHAVGQSPSPSEPWPRLHIKAYDAFINYDTAVMVVDMTRESGAIPPRGGAVALNGEQRQIQAVSGSSAWNVAFAVPAPSPAGSARSNQPPADAAAQTPAPDGGRGRGNAARAQAPTPAPASATERMLQIWMTPHGFLRAAAANSATTRRVDGGAEVSFVLAGTYKITGLINRRNEVAWIRSWLPNPVLGDMVVETAFSNYQKVEAFSFPMRMTQKQGGHPSLDLWLAHVKPNEVLEVTTPDAIRNATVSPVRVEVQPIAPGVHYITGGSHHSVAVEMSDHVVIIEAPLDEARSLAVIEKVTQIVANKPIRFVVNTHHHFDHAGGLRTYADHGAAVVTHEANRAFYETAWAAPRALGPDRLARSKQPVRFETFTDRQVFSDSERAIEIHRLANSPHADGFAAVYLPKERILVEADAYTPTPAVPPVVSPATLNLYQNIRRLNLEVVRIAPLHGPGLVTMAELMKAAGLGEAH